MFNKIPIKLNLELPVPLLLYVWICFAFIVSVLVGYSLAQLGLIERVIEAAKFFFIVTGGGFIAITSYCQWHTSLSTLNTLHDQKELEKTKTSLLILAKWDSDQMTNEREYYRRMRRLSMSKSSIEVSEEIEKDEIHRNAILDIANFFEDVEQAINYQVANEEVLKNGFQPLVASIKATYDPWFNKLAKDDPKYYKQYQPFFNLLERWK